jgi:hypothetical protein
VLATFDIFKKEMKGTLVWCGTSETLEEAKRKAQALADPQSEIFIFNQETQERTTVKFKPAA